MHNSEKFSYERAVYVLKMLEGIPKDIQDIFTPQTEDELLELESNMINFKSREKDREKVMQLQKQHGLPLRPNQILRTLMIRIRIQQLRKKFKNDFSDYGGDNNNINTSED
jgi:hypothetical protein